MIFIYRFFTIIFYPLVIILIYTRKILGKEDSIRFKEKIFFNTSETSRNIKKKLIWFHAASIGETKSIFPIINELKKNNDFEFLITTITTSAARIVEKNFKDEITVKHRFLPFDLDLLIQNFLIIWKPDLVIFVDSEIWPNLIFNIKKRHIPLAIINGRITNKSFKRWMILPKFANKIFSKFDLCLAESKKSTDFLRKLGVKNPKYFGNIKFSANANEDFLNDINKEVLNEKKIWCAVSTHAGEEEFCLKVHNILKKDIKGLMTLIIPRHINRSNEIERLCKKIKLDTQNLKEGDLIQAEKEIVIINSFGALAKYLKYSNSVFIGKSILKKLQNDGGQNPIEAAKYNCKIYHGPYVSNFQEIYDLMSAYKISQEIKDETELVKMLKSDFEEQKNNSDYSTIIDNLGKKILNESINELNKILK